MNEAHTSPLDPEKDVAHPLVGLSVTPIYPRYTYVPGRTPHPMSHPDGHRMVGDEAQSERLSKASGLPEMCTPAAFRNPGIRGQAYYNAGYYWEAHEVWEGAWFDCGRTGELADYWKALIKLAAAGVKAYEQNSQGVIRHLSRAIELLTPLVASTNLGRPLPAMAHDLPTSPSAALALARQLLTLPPNLPPNSTPPVPHLMGRLSDT
ncbi:MAG: DUF309 domain-containing protein [Planctomycetaceae bacterium]